LLSLSFNAVFAFFRIAANFSSAVSFDENCILIFLIFQWGCCENRNRHLRNEISLRGVTIALDELSEGNFWRSPLTTRRGAAHRTMRIAIGLTLTLSRDIRSSRKSAISDCAL